MQVQPILHAKAIPENFGNFISSKFRDVHLICGILTVNSEGHVAQKDSEDLDHNMPTSV